MDLAGQVVSVNGVETYRVRPSLHSADASGDRKRDTVEDYRDVGVDVVDLTQIDLTIQARYRAALSARRRVSIRPVHFAHLVVVGEIDDRG